MSSTTPEALEGAGEELEHVGVVRGMFLPDEGGFGILNDFSFLRVLRLLAALPQRVLSREDAWGSVSGAQRTDAPHHLADIHMPHGMDTASTRQRSAWRSGVGRTYGGD